LLVSSLNEESGVMTALEAVGEVRTGGAQVTLSIYGRGESEYVAQVRSFTIQHQLPVEFLTVSNQNRDLAAIYRQHDALLYTVEWDEPFAMRVVEAMACGLPVIAARAASIHELMQHGQTGLTYTPGNSTNLAARIVELIREPAIRYQLASRAQSDVLQKFNESAIMDQIENFLIDSVEGWRGER